MISKIRSFKPGILFLCCFLASGLFRTPHLAHARGLDISTEEIKGKINLMSYIPQVMVLGKTYTVTVHVENTGATVANFTVVLSADGRYFYINRYRAARTKYIRLTGEKYLYTNYYGYYPRVLGLIKPGEAQTVKFHILPHKPYSDIKPMNITAKLIHTIFPFELELDASYSKIQRIKANTQAQKKIIAALGTISLVVILVYTIFRSNISQHRNDVLLFLGFFAASILIRGITIANQSIYYDEIIYLGLTELAITNEWSLTDIQLNLMPPLYLYLVGIQFYFFGAEVELLRIVSLIAGSLTVSVVYLLGKELFGSKVGFLSALLLCLSGYHIMFSQIVMIEAVSLLSIMSFLYFFWKAYFRADSWLYVLLAGMALGIGILIKFTAFFLVIMMIVLVVISLWTDRRLGALFDRRIIAILVVCGIVIMPYLVYLYSIDCNPFFFNLVTRFRIQTFRPYGKFSLTFIKSALSEYNVLLTRGHYVLPWSPILHAIALPLSFMAVLFHLYRSLKKRSNSVFITVYLLSAAVSIFAFLSRHRYYLIYLLVPNYIAISAFLVYSIAVPNDLFGSRQLRRRLSKLTVLFITATFISSYVMIGMVAPFIEKGEFDGLRRCILYVKDHMDRSDSADTDFPVLLGFIEYNAPGGYGDAAYLADYYLDLYDVDARIVVFFKYFGRVGLEVRFGIDMDAIRALKPKYIIVGEYTYTVYAKPDVRLEMLKMYRIAMSSKRTNPDNWAHFYVFELRDTNKQL